MLYWARRIEEVGVSCFHPGGVVQVSAWPPGDGGGVGGREPCPPAGGVLAATACSARRPAGRRRARRPARPGRCPVSRSAAFAWLLLPAAVSTPSLWSCLATLAASP